MLRILQNIFSNYNFIVLDKVYNEIKGDIKKQLDNQILILKNIALVPFPNNLNFIKEYAMLKSSKYDFGDGESACMAYCKFNNDVIGSSNLNDIKDYCCEYKISYLTTIDFLYYAIKKSIISIDDAHTFLNEVRALDSKLPLIDFKIFISDTIIL